jgi:hypothetical protein
MPENTTARLAYTPDVERATRAIHERVRGVIPDVEWPVHAPLIAAINELKRARNAVILAHNYQSPEIYYGVADYTGDSLGLAQYGARTDADAIVLCGVHFMAETAKILSPDKTVLLPDERAGCSLAASITGADVRALKARHPGVPVVTYVNTSAEVKAESDICCTSANAVKVVESLGVDEVIFIPDQYLGRHVAGRTRVRLILWEGACEVHERFTGDELRDFRRQPAGRAGRGRLRRFHHGHDRARGAGPAGRGGDDHGVLDGRQRRRRVPGREVHPALQPVPAHEADHAAEDPRLPAVRRARGDRRPGRRHPGAGGPRPDAGRRSRRPPRAGPRRPRLSRP